MGNKYNGKKREKIMGTGDDFILEQYEICDELTLNKKNSVIKFDPNLVVSEIKKDPFDDYKVIKTIGEGTFGRVDLVENKITGMIRAMKILNKTKFKNNEALILNELNIMKKINHQNVVKIYEYYSDNSNYYLITEYCSGGDLYKVIKNENLSELQVVCIIYQILVALNHIHKMKIMHRDLKPENILVTKKEENGLYRIKLCDFGTSVLFQDGEIEKLMAGSSFYIAPEVFNRNYNFKCDLWSCGVIMFVLLTKKIPFFGDNNEEIRKNIIKKKYNSEALKDHSNYIQELIDYLLEKDYDKRLNAESALKLDIFKVYNCKDIIYKISEDEIKNCIEHIKKYRRHNVFQETAITYLIHNSDIEEISQALKLFNLLDTNQNGKLGFLEFYEGLCKVTGENLNQNEVKEMFLNLDSNKNNYIEQEEFAKAAVDKKIFLSEKMLKYAFNFFDIDNSGLITVEDIIELFKDNVKSNFDGSSEFNKIISSIDKNENGEIDFDEFSKFMKNLLEEL